MKNVLVLESRAKISNYDVELLNELDLHHRRLTTEVEIFDGRIMFFEFCLYDKYTYRKHNKRTNKPLKKAIRELEKKNAMLINTCYFKESIKCHCRDLEIEKSINDMLYDFNKENILKVINKYGVVKYNEISIKD